MNDFINKILKPENAILILIGGVICLFISPILFTRGVSGFLDFTNSGQIGDTIGGLTAPIIGLLNAILVYLALKSQVEANDKIQQEISTQKEEEVKRKRIAYFQEMIKNLREDIKDFSCSTSVDGKEHNGVIGIRTSLIAISASITQNCIPNEKTREGFLNANLTWGLIGLLYHLTEVINDDLIEERDKTHLFWQLGYIYTNTIQPAINGIKKYQKKTSKYAKNVIHNTDYLMNYLILQKKLKRL